MILMWLSFQETYEQIATEQKVNFLLGAISDHVNVAEDGRQLSAVMLR